MEGGSNNSKGWYKAASGDEGATSSPWPTVEASGTSGGEGAKVAVDAAAAAGSGRRYYECGICKGGFTTAQALGGHMNIHRRGRASRRSGGDRDAPTGRAMATSVSRNAERYCGQYGHVASSYPAAPTSGGFATYYAGAAASAGDAAVGAGCSSPRELSLFGADARHHDLRLGVGRHDRSSGGSGADGSADWPVGEPERMVDLELRLGRRPGR
ncbi:hypothetical protein ACP70R_013022 [Stipagrostis hirtigluma subsp. patula]